jgi:hypothetical protein
MLTLSASKLAKLCPVDERQEVVLLYFSSAVNVITGSIRMHTFEKEEGKTVFKIQYFINVYVDVGYEMHCNIM